VSAVYRVNWLPLGDAALTRAFRRSSLSMHYTRGVTPGNGVYLTSRVETILAAYSYSGIRRWNLGVSGGRDTLDSLTQTIGKYAGSTAGGGATYNVTGALHLITRFDFRHYDVSQTVFRRNSYRASIGIGFSPGEIPLSLW
jgi:hypothetical protein